MSTNEPIGYSGSMERPQAEKVLGGRSIGTFLTRWSPRSNSFVLSYVGKNSVISHIGRIIPLDSDEQRRLTSPITVTTDSKQQQKYDNLAKFVEIMKASGKIKDSIDKRQVARRQLSRRETYEVFHLDSNSKKPLSTEETELVTWMNESGLGEYIDTFLEQGFDIETIRYLNKDALIDMKIIQLAPQLKILSAIEKLSGRPIERPVNLTNIIIGKPIGIGQGGQVFKGIWCNTTHVALKALHESGKDRPPTQSEREAFQKELSILMQMNHPSILRFLGLYKEKEKLYIVTEYMEKGSLLDLLKREDFKTEQLLKMAKDIASGMVYLEQKKIVHRDLSCRNCLVGAGGEVKVGDFGLSRIVEGDYTTSTKTIPYKWCAPEIFEKGSWTHKTDVWSFGVTLWEMFSKGADPYPDKKNQEMAAYINQGGRLQKPDKCPDTIFNIMQSCWEKEPEKRPNFQQLYSSIERLIIPQELKETAIHTSFDKYIDDE